MEATLIPEAGTIAEEKDRLLDGLIAMSRGDDERALAAFTSLLAEDEPSSLAATCAAQLLLKRRDMKGAEAILLAATARDPASAEAHYLLGLACRGMYRNFDAIRCFRAALALEPGNAVVAAAIDELQNVQEP